MIDLIDIALVILFICNERGGEITFVLLEIRQFDRQVSIMSTARRVALRSIFDISTSIFYDTVPEICLYNSLTALNLRCERRVCSPYVVSVFVRKNS